MLNLQNWFFVLFRLGIEYPGKQDFLQSADIGFRQRDLQEFQELVLQSQRICHNRTRQARLELLVEELEQVFLADRTRFCRRSPHYVHAKLLLGMRYQVAATALASLDQPEILQ